MFARVVHVAGTPDDIERGITAYREQVLPYVRDVSGFRGFTLLLDRNEGRALTITFWATQEHLLAYEAAGERFRALLAETWGTPVAGLESYEVAIVELTGLMR